MHGGPRWVPDGEGRGYRRRWWALAVICLALFVLGVDHTILNTAIPRLAISLEPTASQLLWIVDAYVIVFAGMMLVGGTLGDRFGRKHMMMLGLVVFAVGSAVSAWAGSPALLIAGRAVMGLGGAFVMPATLSTVTNIFPAGERTRAVAIWAAIPMAGILAGPLVSGWLLERFWWGSVFLINIPLVPLVLLATIALVPDTRDESRPRVDVVGALLSLVALVALLYAIIQSASLGWTDARVVGAAVAAGMFFTVFALWERRVKQPLIDLALFRDPRFSAASVALTLVFFAMSGMVFALSQYLQFVLGYTPLEAAVRLLPVALSSAGGSILSARLVKPFGRRLIVSGGLALAALALLLMSHVDQVSGYGIVASAQVLLGLGVGLAMAPATDSIMDAVPRAKAGVGSAVNDTTREVGGALGVAVLGAILGAVYTAQMNDTLGVLPVALRAVAADSLAGAFEAARALPAAAASRLVAVAGTSFTSAMSTMLVVGAAVAMMGAVLAYIFVPARRSLEDDSVPGAAARAGGAGVPRRPAEPATTRCRELQD